MLALHILQLTLDKDLISLTATAVSIIVLRRTFAPSIQFPAALGINLCSLALVVAQRTIITAQDALAVAEPRTITVNFIDVPSNISTKLGIMFPISAGHFQLLVTSSF
jgi:hypothetical protein